MSSAADAFPDVNLPGNYLFVLLYFVIGLVFNIFGEEIYYRGSDCRGCAVYSAGGTGLPMECCSR